MSHSWTRASYSGQAKIPSGDVAARGARSGAASVPSFRVVLSSVGSGVRTEKVVVMVMVVSVLVSIH